MRALTSIVLLILVTFPALAWEDINQPDQQVNISKHLRKGRKAMVFFYSRSDKTANRIQVRLAEFEKTDKDWDIFRIRLKKLDSPVARQHNVQQVPAFILYDEKGNETARGNEAFSQVLNLLEE